MISPVTEVLVREPEDRLRRMLDVLKKRRLRLEVEIAQYEEALQLKARSVGDPTEPTTAA